ncbi:MAG: iron-sulfur cluster assembly scaffold protein [Patescibacteria group bacterium]
MNKVSKKNDGVGWVYSDIVKEHFIHPRHFVTGEQPEWEFNGVGEIGSPACGDVMRIWVRIEKGRITNIGWKTFGCASAIASTSILSEMVVGSGGMEINQAKKITAKDIVKALGGLPSQKIHCSVLGDQALKKAIDDYEKKKNKKL